MRVLVISNMYPRAYNSIGGVFVHEQVKALRAEGIDARVVSGGPHWLPSRQPINALRQVRWHVRNNRTPQWSHYDGVPVVYFPYFAGAFCRIPFYPWLYRWALMRWIEDIRKEFPFDLVHAHTAFLDGTAGASVARRFGVPLVLTEHTGPFTLLTRTAAMRIQTEKAVNAADRVLAVSSFLRDEMLRHISVRQPERLTVVPNGVDTAFFTPCEDSEDLRDAWPTLVASDPRIAADTLREIWEIISGDGEAPEKVEGVRRALDSVFRSSVEEGAEGQVISVLWVGHFVDVKRIDRLIDAFAIAHRRDGRLRLTLLGGGSSADVREQIGRLGLDMVVRILPGADRKGVLQEMRKCDFLVVSSETETFGVVAIEALSTGKPVLSTRCGGPQDVIVSPDLGMLVDQDPESMAIGLNAMARRIASFDAHAIREHAVRAYAYPEIAQRLIALYTELSSALASSAAVGARSNTLT